MSFILDALKKAESERNRQLGPVLMDARIAPPRRPLPAWGFMIAAVLVANLAVLAWLLLRTPGTATPVADGGTAATATPPAVANQPVAAPAAGNPPVAAPVAFTPPPTTAPAPQPRTGSPSLSSDAELLPTAQELQAQGVAIPELQLNLHIYDPEPMHRSILLNGQRLREGEFTPNGVRVDRITEQSVVLETGGRRFRIVAGG